MKSASKACVLATVVAALVVGAAVAHGQLPGYSTIGGFQHPTAAQIAPQAVAAPPGPAVVNIHHHYHYPASAASQLASGYSPQTAWHYGYQAGMGTWVEPWKQNWGHLGLYGYLGQRGPNTGLIVDRVVPDGPAAKMGLVRGDFILRINGQPVDTYKQVTLLFDQTAKADPQTGLRLYVWNPATGRKITITSKTGD